VITLDSLLQLLLLGCVQLVYFLKISRLGQVHKEEFFGFFVLDVIITNNFNNLIYKAPYGCNFSGTGSIVDKFSCM